MRKFIKSTYLFPKQDFIKNMLIFNTCILVSDVKDLYPRVEKIDRPLNAKLNFGNI